MKNKYKIKYLFREDIYLVYEIDKDDDYVFSGTLEEVNAWISLKEKGYDF